MGYQRGDGVPDRQDGVPGTGNQKEGWVPDREMEYQMGVGYQKGSGY